MVTNSLSKHGTLFGWLLALGMCAVLAAVVLPPFAHADEDGATSVRVGYYENEVFQEGAQEGAVKTGYAYEYYRKISEYTGWSYDYVYGDYGSLYQKLLDGDIDLLAGLAFREERAGLIGYPEQAMGNESYTLVKHATDDSITADPATLSGKTIGVLESALVNTLDAYLAEHQVKADVVTFDDYEKLFDAFDGGKVDVLAAEGDGAYGRDDAEVTAIFGASDYYLCVNVNRADLLGELDAAQAQLLADEPGYIASLHAKYYPHSMSSRAFTAAEKDWLEANDTLRVGYLDNYLPYSDTDSQGQATGLVCDIFPLMLEGLSINGVDVTYTGFGGYDAMIEAINAGEIDVAFPVGGGLYYSEENGIYQSNPVASTSTELVYKGEYDDTVLGNFAVNQNNRMQDYYVRTNYPDAQITYYPSIDECLRAVVAGDAGCTTLNGLRANDMLKNREYHELSMMQLQYSDDRCFGVRIGDENLLKLLNRGLNVLGEDYALNLASRYTDGLYTYSAMDFVTDNVVPIGALATAIAALIIAFFVRDSRRSKRQMEEQETARLELERKNMELEGSRAALADALSSAESANRAKTVFLNNMSHDIRTPMNAIVGFSELAADHAEDPALVRDYLGKVSVSSQHLLALINDVLDMSRIESGKVQMDEAPVNVRSLVEELQAIVQPGLSEKRLGFTLDMEGIEHSDIISDKLRLEQVLLNILSNAVKFTPEGGHIALTVHELPSDQAGCADFEFRVKDDGIGMSEEFQKTLFDAFTRERTSTVSGIQGTGLGMAITKNIVDMMGGSISVESAVGEGSEFTVRIPCKLVDAGCGGAGLDSPASAPVQDGAERAGQTAFDFSGKRVLLAEDNMMNQQIALAILEGAGFAVDVADDGAKAVEMLESAPPKRYDVVLMDIQMPQMDGFEAARRIRALDDPAKAGIPIIAVTANAFEEDRNLAMAVGMNAHLPKPYDVPKMMETLADILG